MARILLIVALLLILFWVYSIVDCAVQHPSRHRGVSKPVWILIVALLPVLGGVLWFAVGRTRSSAMPRPKAPDDDPEFLGRIGDIRDTDERIRRIEEELKALDSEDDDPHWGNPPPPRPTDA
ncbi:PLD nuclease N-terminal domain-containing protein [Microbacterium sp. zg.Y1090]|uniref:PLD nuclease N-terminal domain-containing protein n=1 Tax=Microbacterium TaxID=33882 RepID=UPI00214B642D|nr:MULTISPECIES: PLD nuclease N-terminal domain-containing protein [unclassified Microbacterium]MCR2812552.1 PLD nuclease N-terminal domain-containing protein [Microbacterium sp. zg.Y1084]MCR2817647.1 PLD nuclease N-terminal domain-containing protein [Microbacterium sp. zg.Y1090]MDL5485710.1 PLD nuclease N-terminal domain-containing protein [Microbacterium sp. zg-Y1211]WIM28879.1 PLD nuclease N-terminal domain-containing protein [Microbacterium sp. zg-Y1090]